MKILKIDDLNLFCIILIKTTFPYPAKLCVHYLMTHKEKRRKDKRKSRVTQERRGKIKSMRNAHHLNKYVQLDAFAYIFNTS